MNTKTFELNGLEMEYNKDGFNDGSEGVFRFKNGKQIDGVNFKLGFHTKEQFDIYGKPNNKNYINICEYVIMPKDRQDFIKKNINNLK